MFVVRSSDRSRRDALKRRVEKCFSAGALATGATLTVTQKGSYDDHMPNKTLGLRFRNAFNRLNHDKLGGAIPAPELDTITGATMASTDQGNVSYAMPSISVSAARRSLDLRSLTECVAAKLLDQV